MPTRGRLPSARRSVDVPAGDWRDCVARAVGGSDARKELLDSFDRSDHNGAELDPSLESHPEAPAHPTIRRPGMRDKAMSFTNFVLNARRWLCVGILAVAAGEY